MHVHHPEKQTVSDVHTESLTYTVTLPTTIKISSIETVPVSDLHTR